MWTLQSDSRRVPWVRLLGLLGAMAYAVSPAGSASAAEDGAAEDAMATARAVSPASDPWTDFHVSSGGRSLANAFMGLQFVRAPGDNVAFTRAIDVTAGQGIVCKFNLSVSGIRASDGAAQVFRVGAGFDASNTDESSARTYARLGVKATGGEFRLRDLESGTSSMAFRGTQALTWVINAAEGLMSYAGPNGAAESIAKNRMDVWIGRNRVFNDIAVTNASVAPRELKWLWNAGSGVTTFDHFEIAALVPVDAVAGKVDAAVAPGAASEASPSEASSSGSLELYRPSPNPFTGAMALAYAVPGKAARVQIDVYDLSGRRVRSLVSGVQEAGEYRVRWDGRDERRDRVKQGVYFLRTAVGTDTRVLRVVHMGY